MEKSNSHNARSKKAFRLTNKILFSYVRLFLLKKLLGKHYYEKRIEALHVKNAKRLKEGLVELKGLFIKVGQLLSIMSSVLPDQYMDILESLQDNAPASPFSETKETLEAELGESIEELFIDFNETPIASASIGQVYKAKLKSGEKVAVKIQHSNIEYLAAADLNTIQKLIRRISIFIKIGGIEHVYGQVRLMIEEELNYVKEAESMILIASNIEKSNKVLVPKVYSEYSSKRVLVTDFYEGVKITDTEQLDTWKINREELVERLTLVYCKMILEDGFYHADPHPGNILVNEEGDIILLDFGAVAVLDEKMRKEIPVLVQAIIRKDKPKILLSFQIMGFVGSDKESQKVATKLIDALSYFLQNEIQIENLNIKDIKLEDIKGSSIDNLRKELSIKELTKTIQVPKDWILLDRTLILMMGISSRVAPELNPLDVVKPYLKKQILSGGGLRKIILDTIKQQFTDLLALPSELNTFLKKANNGDLEIEVKDKNMGRLYALGQQLILTLFIISTSVLSLVLYNNWPLYLTVVFGLLLIRSVWKHRK